MNSLNLYKKICSSCIELHTGSISRKVRSKKNIKKDLKKIISSCNLANSLGLEVHAVHVLDYKSASILSKIKLIKEFNIGHFIVGESFFLGLPRVINKFKKICK